MSTLNAERLYALLPSVYRIRDEREGQPLRALVSLIANEIEALEEDVEQLYDDQFIETCADWAAPYIGDLIGYRPLHGVVPKVASPRAEVANTIAYRRRKGTAAMLEQLARDVTGWPARAVEFFEQLATTQYMNHTRRHAQATAEVRSLPRMLGVDGPFNTLAHTAEMRSPEAGAGRYNLPNIGIFLWRLAPMSVSQVPLTPHPGDATGSKFRFNPLGTDQPLFRKPQSEDHITHLAEPVNVPAPLRIRELALQFRAAQAGSEVTDHTQDYGADGSFALYRHDAVVPINTFAGATLPSIALIRMADLRDVAGGWAHQDGIQADEIAIDPERGRILLGANRATEHATAPFSANYHRGFSRNMAGGEYERTPMDATQVFTEVNGGASFQAVLDAVAGGARVCITDNLNYAFTPTFKVDAVNAVGAPGLEVTVAAKNGARPVITASGPIVLDIGARGRLVLDGLVMAGGTLQLAAAADDEPRELVLRHCTLLPGAVSLRICHPFARVTLQDCILGGVQIDGDAILSASGCLIDAGAPEAIAMEGLAAGTPAAELTLRECTVVGKVCTRLMRLASNTLFHAQLASADSWAAPIRAERRQQGCVRFSYVPEGSLLPRRHRCVPDAEHPYAVPRFTSLRYVDPGYGQLGIGTDRVIREGADDGSEIGALHALHLPQRETNLRLRLDEYLRFGLRAGIFYVT